MSVKTDEANGFTRERDRRGDERDACAGQRGARAGQPDPSAVQPDARVGGMAAPVSETAWAL